jgi:hypothetical protein
MTFLITTTDEAKARLVHILKNYHVGQGKAIKKRDLLREVFGDEAAKNESYNNLDDRALRDMMNKANDEGALICSSSRLGYWWAADLKDGLASVYENRARAETQFKNTRQLEANLEREFGGQLGMGL